MDELRQAIISETNSRTRERLLAIFEFNEHDIHPKQIAAKMKDSIRTIKNWIKRYLEEGIAGLSDKPRSGRPRKVPKITLDDFMKRKGKLTTPKQTRQEILEEFGCKYALAYVRALLRECGYSPKTAQKIHVKAASRKEVRKWRRKILPKIKEYEEAGYTVFVMDESHFVYDSRTGKKYWTRIAEPVYMSTNGAHQKITMFGANSTNGKQFFRCYKKLTTSKFIDYLKAMYSVHGKVLAIADLAPSHQSNKTKEFVKNHSGIELEHFPRRSPYLNSVEKCWRQTKHDQQNSEYYESMKEMKKSVSKHLGMHRFKLSVLKYLKRDPPKQKVVGWKTG